jgi:glyoxylase-like metal-dependent hydrolase (beta-lactamase superfamily II)
VQVIEGIYQLLTPFPDVTLADAKTIRGELEDHPRVMKGLPYVMPYLLKDGGDVVLLDCGWNTDAAYAALEEGMKEHGSHPTEVQRLVVSHVHPDHFGMAGRLKQLSSCEVILHEKDAEVISSRYFAPQGLADNQGRFMEAHGVPKLDSPQMARGSMGMLNRVAAVPADTQLKGGEVIKVGDFDFEVIWTPGHSPGHICLYEPNRKILLTGDHILPTITPNVSIHMQTHGSPLGDYIRSLDKLVDLDVKYCLPAHEFDIRDLKKRIQEIEDHHKHRLDEMVGCVDKGGSTAWEVAGRVVWATGKMADFEPWVQRSAVGETLAHLEYLFEVGRLAKVMRGELAYWLPV